MTIKEFSILTGLTISTIRYYDKLGLFPSLERDYSGYRSFSEKDINWAQFLNRLKETGMKINDIVKYSKLRNDGDTTISLRLEILKTHRYELKKRLEKDTEHLENLDKKIEFYKNLLP